MANKTPIDLTDQLALRRYLENLVVEPPVFRPAVTVQGDLTKLYSVPVLTNAELKYYVENLVKDFDTRMWSTINEVKYNLATIIPDEDTIVKTVETSLDLVGSNLNSSVKGLSVVAIDESGLWATSSQLNALQSEVTGIGSDLSTNYATVTTLASTYATQTAVGAIYEVSVEANGHVSGYRSVATGTNSVFQIYAEQFAISSSSTTEGYSPFQVDTVNHKINMTSDVAIDGNLIVSGTIDAAQVNVINLNATNIKAGVIYNTGGNATTYTMKIDLDNGSIYIQ